MHILHSMRSSIHKKRGHSTMQQTSLSAKPAEYANFGARLVAFILDRSIIAVICFVLAWLLTMITSSLGGDGTVFVYAILMMYLLGPIYFSVLESSSLQATWGKRLLGIKVVDYQGNRLSFMHALGRNLGGIVSSFIPFAIGYFMAAFTQRKQAIHDIIASCLVVSAENEPGVAPVNESTSNSNVAIVAICAVVFFVLIAVVGILAAIAIPHYQDYTVRARLANVMVTAKSIAPKVDEYFVDNKRLPRDIQELGVALSAEESKYIKSIQIDQRTGQVIARITGVPTAEGMRLLFTPSKVGAADNSWKCSSEEIAAKLLPPTCRQK
jgi:uncharacterized RDD family membrane protein YckC/Tfp pilus assembly protein PilE